MQNTSTLLLACIWVLALLGSCGAKDRNPIPVQPEPRGSIYGFVRASDQNGTPVSKAGFTVELEGIDNQKSTTDADGRFEFLNVRAGTYNLTYTRTGYATYKEFGVSHAGGNAPTVVRDVSVTVPSSTIVSNLTAGVPNSSGIPFSLKVSNSDPANTTYRVVFFAGKTAAVTAATGELLITYDFGSAVGQKNSIFSRDVVRNAGFAPGSTVYLVAYGVPVQLMYYQNPATGQVVYPSLNSTPSNVVSFVL
ncbi:carboxypeptidase-like regulatory domain-containing protein [Hymenobacter lapidiphilus]|uniref:Carboxypeptidase regulatory-like domain-containing protein n=1 Tax=Hymenobacter lapidiphilus TaxID=2608003 RepID=A0A7Y7U658_9BACT|nr:carboxypeptidase-like regulatory domain-containing protein [Hymenobacter lapidiphilus]NVO31424.1 carboxypeptidase regulatory-like domain-containing protein [Hymenobacter lapidiphilus]